MVNSIEQIISQGPSAEATIINLNDIFQNVTKANQAEDISGIESLMNLQGHEYDWRIQIFIDSFLLSYSNSYNALNRMMDIMEKNGEIDAESYIFIYWQLMSKLFGMPEFQEKLGLRLNHLYENIYNFFNANFSKDVWIPLQNRNSDLVVVITNQFLTKNHAPTKITIDYCEMLLNQMGKRVILINTADMPREMATPYFGGKKFAYFEEYNEPHVLDENNLTFYQFKASMPSISEMNHIFEMIKELRPECVLSIGGSNLTADLCSNYVPVITIPCTMEFPITMGTFSVLFRKTKESDYKMLKYLEDREQQLVESELAYTAFSTGKKLFREEWGLTELDLSIVIVGNRLVEDLSVDFLEGLDSLLARKPQIKILIVGDIERSHFQSFNTLSENIIFMGYQNDLSALYSICDIYLNPPRIGGGTSAAYALYEGVPVISYPIGDVSHVLGGANLINSLEELDNYIDHWTISEEFRLQERKKAKDRAGEIFDPNAVFARMMDKVRNDPKFL